MDMALDDTQACFEHEPKKLEIRAYNTIDIRVAQHPQKKARGTCNRVGPAGLKNGGGTLGGFFEFRHTGEEGSTAYEITNYHVAVIEGTKLSTGTWRMPY
jgi:hypothetical protein